MNAINNLAEHATAVADGSIIEHQKKRLAELEAAYSVATKSLNYELTQDIAKRINRIRTALVLHGAMDSIYDVDREAREAEDAREKPFTVARWS